MAYAGLDDMVERYGEAELIRLTAPEGQLDSTVIDLPRLATALADASDRIDSYIGRRYGVPLASPPGSIRAACCTLARYALATAGGSVPSEAAKAERDETTSWLKRIGEGEAVLPGLTPANLGAGAQTADRPAMFTPDTLRGW